MVKCKYCIGLVVLIALFSVSCANKHNKLLKSTDHDKKYEAAVAAFDKKDYFHASQLFENLMLYYRGRQKAESVAFYYAQSLMGMKDYYSAGYQFESFYKRFAFSANAEEALYLAAYCKYHESPDYSLDQTITKEAIRDFQTFVDKYPKSERMPEVNKFMDEMRDKLIKKDYETAYLYYKTGNYQSAQVMLRLFLNNYPDSQYRQEAMYHIILAGYELASNSVEQKQKVRFEAVVADYHKYETLFSEQDKAKQEKLLSIYNLSRQKLEQIK
ncbi:MAG: outer membrane protein assembly factor BamD [Bacteroidales bacterium]|jgi:outer membrane protein assembly factor BamD|nr:outer membrane protein assembly factor BamD [Bacteroidales bacterium]